jgi:hypothetical protein|nr:MAG TPA: hypothetical protein [Caudoviricetes sp.]
MATVLNFGGRVAPLNVGRCDVAVGYTGRVVLISGKVWMKNIAWDAILKCFVEVTQEGIIKYRLSPTQYYYLLVFRLNTDIRGDVYGNDVTVEYLRLSSKQYDDLIRQVHENPAYTSFILNKEKRKNDDGKDVSYLKVSVSSAPIAPDIINRVREFGANPDRVDQLWAMVDASTSITEEQYEKKLLELASKDAPASTFDSGLSSSPVNGIAGGYSTAPQVPSFTSTPTVGSASQAPSFTSTPAVPVAGTAQAPVFTGAPAFGATPSESGNFPSEDLGYTPGDDDGLPF